MKNKKILKNQIKTTIVFGYSLFFLNLIAVIISMVVFSKILFEPQISQLNMAVLMVFLISHMILPTLVSYLVGDKAAHAKNKLLHHYNGVLFGLAAYWLAGLFTNLGSLIPTIANDANTPFIIGRIVTAWPIIATITIMTIVAIFYNRQSKNTKTMMQYPPYQIVLFSAIIGNFILISVMESLATANIDTMIAMSLPYIIMIIFTLISYIVIAKVNNSIMSRIAQATLASTIGLISILLFAQLLSNTPIDSNMNGSVSIFAGLMTWVIYLVLMSRKS